MSKTKITVIENNAEVKNLIQGFLTSKGYEVELSPSSDVAQQTYSNPSAKTDLIIMDAVGGAALVNQMKKLQPYTPVILLSTAETQEQANEGVRSGAIFYLLKQQLKLSELGMVVEMALKQSKLQKEVIQLRDQISVDEQNSSQSIFADFPNLGELEKRYMKIVLEKTKGRKEKAARILGINRRTLYRKEREYGWVADDGSQTDSSEAAPAGAKPNVDLGLQSGMDH